MDKKVLISSKRTIYSYVVMYQTINHALMAARKSEEGRFFNCMIAMIFSAFCLEAYFNHLGRLKLKYWGSIERKISPEDKFEILTQILNFPVDIEARPFKDMKEILIFRNSIAHAKTEYLMKESVQISDENPELPKTKWEEKINLENAQRFFEDIEYIVIKLHQTAFGIDRHPFGVISKAQWGGRPIENKNKPAKNHQ